MSEEKWAKEVEPEWLKWKRGRFSKSVLRFWLWGLCSAAVGSETMADDQVAETIELNDGTRMPLLGLGTWKVWWLQYSLSGKPWNCKEHQDLNTFN